MNRASLYGMVIAASRTEPYAFMITAKQMLSDIRAHEPTMASIGLYIDEPEETRLLGRGSNAESTIHTATQTTSTAPPSTAASTLGEDTSADTGSTTADYRGTPRYPEKRSPTGSGANYVPKRHPSLSLHIPDPFSATNGAPDEKELPPGAASPSSGLSLVGSPTGIVPFFQGLTPEHDEHQPANTLQLR